MAMPAAGAAAAARCGASLLTPRSARRLVQLVRSATAAGGDVEVGTAAERETYLEIASRPSRFQESQWGPEDVCVVLLEAMRIQWNHGYPSTPRGYPRTTHGFHEYPAGMQAAAADRILDVLPGNSLLDPFAGGGTSLVVGMSKGRETFGVDVSPLAAFVATHRTWRPAPGAEEETFEWMRATATAALRLTQPPSPRAKRKARARGDSNPRLGTAPKEDGAGTAGSRGRGARFGVRSEPRSNRQTQTRLRRPRRASAGPPRHKRSGSASPSRSSARRRAAGNGGERMGRAGTRTSGVMRKPRRRTRGKGRLRREVTRRFVPKVRTSTATG